MVGLLKIGEEVIGAGGALVVAASNIGYHHNSSTSEVYGGSNINSDAVNGIDSDSGTNDAIDFGFATVEKGKRKENQQTMLGKLVMPKKRMAQRPPVENIMPSPSLAQEEKEVAAGFKGEGNGLVKQTLTHQIFVVPIFYINALVIFAILTCRFI